MRSSEPRNEMRFRVFMSEEPPFCRRIGQSAKFQHSIAAAFASGKHVIRGLPVNLTAWPGWGFLCRWEP